MRCILSNRITWYLDKPLSLEVMRYFFFIDKTLFSSLDKNKQKKSVRNTYKAWLLLILHYIEPICLQNCLFRSYQSLYCYTADCGPPPFLLNGAVSYQDTTEGSEVRYHCNDGFTLEGGMTTVCGANGSWDSIPFCRQQKGMLTSV